MPSLPFSFDMRRKWLSLALNNIPSSSGVYGFKVGKRWLYIGKADNLKRRLTQRHIPLQIALECFPRANLYYILSETPLRLEKQLHEQLKPEWNGRTAIRGGKFPSCEIPYDIKMTPEERHKALSVIGF
jgi:excinuclease UvrABC nuclease subunit